MRNILLTLLTALLLTSCEYKEYEPSRDQYNHYVWKATHRRHWWGPTKAEVSIKWLLERKKKGGKR